MYYDTDTVVLAQSIARNLDGPWELDQEWSKQFHGAKIRTAGGKCLHMVQHHGRLEISADYGATEYCFDNGEVHRSITVAASRGGPVIAREITRRFMPGYLEVLAKVRKDNERKAACKAARNALVARILDVLPDAIVDKAGRKNQSRLFLKKIDECGSGDITVAFQADTVNVSLNWIDPERAIRMLAALAADPE